MAKYQITLTFPHVGREGDVYQVDSVKGSTEFKPRQLLTEEEVNDLCKRRSTWDITMKQNKERQ